MRSLTIRLVQGLCVMGAMVVLTGANGEGCSAPGETDGGTEPSEPNPCEPGTHLELICDDHPCDDDGVVSPGDDDGVVSNHGGDGPGLDGGGLPGENCYEECVPDEVCPPGTQEELICAEPMPYPDCGPDEEFCDAPPPPEPGEDCFIECVPIDDCGPGFYQEWVCEDYAGGDPGDPDGAVPLSMPCYEDEYCEPPPPEECFPICLPIDDCGPGSHEEFICDEPPGLTCDSDADCSPDGDAVCIEGVCDFILAGPEGEEGGGISEPFCDVICVPDDGGCPPDAEPIMICEEWDGWVECWEECGYVNECPPPLVLEVICEDSPDGMGGQCYEECVDPGDTTDPGEPEPNPDLPI